LLPPDEDLVHEEEGTYLTGLKVDDLTHCVDREDIGGGKGGRRGRWQTPRQGIVSDQRLSGMEGGQRRRGDVARTGLKDPEDGEGRGEEREKGRRWWSARTSALYFQEDWLIFLT
jgi:hypothetical protein